MVSAIIDQNRNRTVQGFLEAPFPGRMESMGRPSRYSPEVPDVMRIAAVGLASRKAALTIPNASACRWPKLGATPTTSSTGSGSPGSREAAARRSSSSAASSARRTTAPTSGVSRPRITTIPSSSTQVCSTRLAWRRCRREMTINSGVLVGRWPSATQWDGQRPISDGVPDRHQPASKKLSSKK